MKFKFKIQDYQTEAVNAVVKVFEGQPYKDKVAYLRDLGRQKAAQIRFATEEDVDENGSGFENGKIELTEEELLANIRDIQLDNNIKQSDALSKPLGAATACSLDIEMETGTGKTYCYIKTIFELNKKYGWSKFIVVVPSIAIREGVKKSFEITEEHFFEYYGKKARHFIYNSSNLNQIDSFSANKDISVMIINAQAFATSLKEGARNEAARIIYTKRDDFASRRPIDVIKANRPILILDEPQKLSGEATQTSLKMFCPLFSINYSATHRDMHNLVYVLDALDAYNKKLVKKIEVKGFELKNLRGTEGFVYLSGIILSEDKPPVARIMFEIKYQSGKINREPRIAGVNYDLYRNSNEMEQYRNGYVIKEINPINNTVTFLNGKSIRIGVAEGDVSEKDLRRIQIRETIVSHFEKEEKLFLRGIKCLSLFFIDEVAKYRLYSEDGAELNGEYGVIFEEEYLSVLNDYLSLVETPYTKYLKGIHVKDTHKGYFSIDKKTNRVVNSTEKKGECDDISAYDLILKNKERLLSFEEPTRFIFSHSALREGWDNPNVFQICTLKQSDAAVTKRQEVGRGMRLCVDRAGDRMDATVQGIKVHDINILTVIASDSYKTFVSDLQKDIRKDLYDRPTKATKEYFEGKRLRIEGEISQITKDQARKIEFYLIQNGYIDFDGNVTDHYRAAQESGTFAVMPADLLPMTEGIHKLIQGIFDESVLGDMVADGNKSKIEANNINENFYKKEFQTLWNYINHKYAYTVEFNSAELVKKAVTAIDAELYVSELKYITELGVQKKELERYDVETGDSFQTTRTRTQVLRTASSNIRYDLVGKIAQGAMLTRKTATEILKRIAPSKFIMFRNNPEEFIIKVSRYINEQKATMIVDGITYDKTDGTYESNIFTAEKGVASIDKAVKAARHITPWVVCDSDTERNFARDLEAATSEVCVYAKLPKSFSIPTPVGNYAPDWAIAFYEGSVKHIYFIAETKGTLESLQLKKIEFAKINCARKLFDKLSDGKVKYDVADTYQHLLDLMNK